MEDETTVSIFVDARKWYWHRYDSTGETVEGPIGPFSTRNKVMDDLRYEEDTIVEPEDK